MVIAPTGPWVKVHRAVSDFKTLAPLCDLSIWGHFSKAKDVLQWPTDNSPSNRTLTRDCVMDGTLSNGKQIADLLGRVCVFYPLAHVWLIHPEQMRCRRFFFFRIPLRSFSLCYVFFSNSGSFHSPTFQTNVNDDAHSIVINQRSATVYSQSVYLIQSHSGECRSPVSLAFSETAQSVTAISHSMAQPNPVSSHVDCIRIGRPGARLEARGYLSYLWTETWFRKSTWSGESDNSDSLQRTILIALLLKTLPWI